MRSHAAGGAALFLLADLLAAPRAATAVTISVDFAYDAGVPLQVARTTAHIIRERIMAAPYLRPVPNLAAVIAKPLLAPVMRESLVERARNTGAQFATDIRLSNLQVSLGATYLSLRAWTVSADSSAYVVVAQTMWDPGDTAALTRSVGDIVRRLVPPSAKALCYAEVADPVVHRDAASAVTEGDVSIRVYRENHLPCPHAWIEGRWLVNARPGGTDAAEADSAGVAHFHFDARELAYPVGDVDFLVDSVKSPGVTYDPDFLQREVDEGIALLENARADLDEDHDYDRAIERASRFADLTEHDIVWYGLLMTPLDAPDRRQQALNIMRRARFEQGRANAGKTHHAPAASTHWYGVWIGNDAFQSKEPGRIAAMVGCDTCAGLPLSVSATGRTEFGGFARMHMGERMWMTVQASVAFRTLTVSSAQSDKRTQDIVSVASLVGIPWNISDAVRLYDDTGVRLERISESAGLRYWSGGIPYAKELPSGAQWVEPPASVHYYPGIETHVGASVRMSDWQPIRLFGEITGAIQRVDGGHTVWQIGGRFGVSYGR